MEFFSKETIERNIKKCKASIEAFEIEEQKERQTIREYQEMIDSGNSPFPVQSLENGIESSKNKIKVFQGAIDRERDLISTLYNQIEHNQEQQALEKEKEAHIEIIRE